MPDKDKATVTIILPVMRPGQYSKEVTVLTASPLGRYITQNDFEWLNRTMGDGTPVPPRKPKRSNTWA